MVIEEDDEITKLANEIKNLGVIDEKDEFSPFEPGEEMNKDGLKKGDVKAKTKKEKKSSKVKPEVDVA